MCFSRCKFIRIYDGYLKAWNWSRRVNAINNGFRCSISMSGRLKMAYILMINSDVAAVYSNRQAARKDAKHFREKGQNTSIMTVPYNKQSILE